MCQDAECCCLWGIAQWSSCPRVQRVLHSQSCRSLQAPLHRIGTYWTCTWKPRKSEKNAWGDMGAHIPTCSKQNLRDFLAMLGGDGFSWEQVWEKSTVSYTDWSKHRWGSHAVKVALPFHLIINGDTCAWLAHWLPHTAQDHGSSASQLCGPKPVRFPPENPTLTPDVQGHVASFLYINYIVVCIICSKYIFIHIYLYM